MPEPTPQISVIVPIYNTEKWLRRCLESILAQTFTDFELLLIDDGSTDSSGAICDKYAEKDSRIRIFHKPNGGVSSARNLGLDNARGEWITFVDSDDWIGSSYIENLINQPGKDFHLSLFWIEHSDNSSNASAGRAIYNQELTQQQSIDQLTSRLWNICSNLYRKDIITYSNLRFKEGLSMGEDTFFNYGYLAHSKSISICRNFDYHYHQDNQDSLSRKKHTIDEIDMFVATSDETLSKFPKKIDLKFANQVLGNFIIYQLFTIKAKRKTVIYYCRNNLAVKEYLRAKNLGLRQQMVNRLLRLGLYHIAHIIY